MAYYENVCQMMANSLKELLYTANLCIDFDKSRSPHWPNQVGCLGFPAAMLLLSIVDVIGSVHEGDSKFTVLVDGEKKKIAKEVRTHFQVLNSHYYGELDLRGGIISKIYECYRCCLVHNAAFPSGYFLNIGDDTGAAFEIGRDENGDLFPKSLNLRPFYILSKNAVDIFVVYLIENCAEIVKRKRMKKIIDRARSLSGVTNISLTSSGMTQAVVTTYTGTGRR